MLSTWISLFTTVILRLFKRSTTIAIQQVITWNDDVPFISIIIPCYNHGQYVKEAVQSILNQTWQNFEIIVVNDGSTEEETVEILKDFYMPKTTVLHLPQNMGLPAARNAGIHEAKGKYICCLDADDKLHPTYLHKTIVAMEVNAGLSIVGSWVQVFGSESRVWYTPQFNPDEIIYNNQFSPPAVFKRSAWEFVGGYFEKMREGFEDWEFWVRLTGHGYRGFCISEKMILYRRIGYSFALRAAEKKETLFEVIKENNPNIYVNPKGTIKEIKNGYRDVYCLSPFVNLDDRRQYLKIKDNLRMVVSELNSEATIEALVNKNVRQADIWVARRALDERAIDLLYQTIPFVYVLPNFLPKYVHFEFIQNLIMIWEIQLIQKL